VPVKIRGGAVKINPIACTHSTNDHSISLDKHALIYLL
jgi:hypothetical protein